jgi:hypothetical protein
MNNCQNFSSSVMRPTRSRTRDGVGSRASWYGAPACADASWIAGEAMSVTITSAASE